jgi:hypothetical protein
MHTRPSAKYQMTEQFSNLFAANPSIRPIPSFQPQAVPIPETPTPTRRRGKKTGKRGKNADD